MNSDMLPTANIKTIKDSALLDLAKEKAQVERNLTMEVIGLLQEIFDRRLHLKRGYSSLHQYCVKELKYSDGAAYRRIKAMKLTQEMPEVAKSIESGSLSLCTASQLQTAFESKAQDKKPIPTEMKMALVAQVENQSRRQVERVLVEICPKVVKNEEKITIMSTNQAKLELVIDQELLNKLERLKALTSHKNKNLKDLLHQLVDEALLKMDPAQKAETKRQKALGHKLMSEASTNKSLQGEGDSKSQQPPPALGQSVRTRHIPRTTKQKVWVRDRGQCTYFDRLTKRKCASTHKLQFEHIEAYSYGGQNTAENLRLLCSAHNALTAKQHGLWQL
jgi:hypothetical protein